MRYRIRGALTLACALLLAGCQTDIGRDRADEHDKTALMYAAERGDMAAVRHLLDEGARVDQTVRRHPAMRELLAFLMFMQELPDRDPGYAALHYAIAGRHLDVAELLLERGADPNAAGDAMSPLQLVLLTDQAARGLPLLLAHGASLRRVGDGPDPGNLVATAVGQSDTAALRVLLEGGADPDAGNPLAAVAQRGDSLIAETLLEAGADPNQPDRTSGWTPGMLARDEGHLGLAKRLGAGDGTPQQLAVDLAAAVMRSDVGAVEQLLEQGADAGSASRFGHPVLVEAVRRGRADIAELLLEAGASPHVEQHGVPLFTLATQAGDTLLMAALLRHGADASVAGAATHAAGAGAVAVLRQLHAAGADLREHGDAPLRQAAFGGHGEAVAYLLSLGADPNAPDANGTRPLDRAVARGGLETTRVLLEAGADPNGPDDWTPLMDAAMSADTAMMALLLEFGADPARRDESGKNAADFARGAGKAWAADWLDRRVAGP